MADKDLTLRLRMDKTGAEASAQQFHAAEMARIGRLRDAHGRFLKQGTEGVEAQQRAVGGLGASVEKVGFSMGSLQAAWGTALAAVGGIKAIADAWNVVADNAVRSGQAALEYEGRVRSLAAVQNIDKPAAAVAGALKFASQTGFSLEKAQAFQEAFLGSSPAGVEKGNITQDVLEKVMVEAGIMARRQGADVKTRGDLAGIMAQFKKYTDPAEVLGDIEKVRYALTAGRGEDKPLTDSLLHVAGSLVKEHGGMVADLPQLAAQIGTHSLTAGAMQSDVRTEQLARGLRGTTSKQMKFLQEWAGIDEHDDMEQRVDKGVAALRKTMASGRDPTTFLVESGMNAEQTRALVEMEGVYEVYKQRLAKAREQGTGEAVRKANKEFQESPLGRFEEGKMEKEAAGVVVGQKNKSWSAVLEKAEAQWIIEHRDESEGEAFANILGGIGTGTFSAEAGRKSRIRGFAVEKLREQAAGMGILGDVEKRRYPLGGFVRPETAEEGRILSEEIGNAGGVPGSNMTGVSEGIDELVAIEKEKARERTNAAPPPLPAGRPTTAAMAR